MSSTTEALAPMMILALAAVLLATAARQPSPVMSTTTTNLTLHNLCPYPVWPLVTANAGNPSIPTDADGEPAGRLDGNGEGLATLAFPPGAWSGRVVARTGCTGGDDNDEADAYDPLLPTPPLRCTTGDAPPVTVAQVSVGGTGGAAAYSVSLVDGFNVAVVVTPHGMPPEGTGPRRRCPTLGCAVDLGAECPHRAPARPEEGAAPARPRRRCSSTCAPTRGPTPLTSRTRPRTASTPARSRSSSAPSPAACPASSRL
uniref:Pathogenesis-related protein 5 n=1 Tax=Zea mays TaxID=4577 RepID=B6TQD3_MAIZE|nr:pathogenesis-related protein 5 precursor [Zea mays]|eukprot:NP_001150507.1 pathogenesis-related protein 5 precursor [Zea mays]